MESIPKFEDAPPDVAVSMKKQARFTVDGMLSCTRTILVALGNGIPVELAFTVPPETKKAILKEFHDQAVHQPIKEQVKIMIELLERHFPQLQSHSLQWMGVRAYFFGSVGLWGKFG